VKAKQALLRLLNRRELNSAQALKKLLDREFPFAEAKQAIAECESAGFVDDRRWAEGRVRALLRRKKGNSYIRQKLAQEGLDKELITDALPSEKDQEEALQRLLTSRYSDRDMTDLKIRQKTVQALQRQGFPLSLILNSPEISHFS